jgi:hypothetical protein
VARARRRKKPRRFELAKALEPLIRAWREGVAGPRARAVAAASALVFVAVMLLARVGTVRSRAGAAAILVSLGAGWLFFRWRERRRLADPRTVLADVAAPADPEGAARAVRALSLLDEDGEPRDPGTSPALAKLHVARALASLPEERVREHAARIAVRFRAATLFGLAAAIGVLAIRPWGFFEGIDVLFAWKGVAPVDMAWLGDLEVVARPPDYLHEKEREFHRLAPVALPRGTLITVRGAPLHAGRRLLLSDGHDEVPFVDDGSGKVVARWPVESTVELHVVARFGDVVIRSLDTMELTSIPDEAPTVTLDGAPRQVLLAGPDEVTEIPIKYEAEDDHGLREVHLVLRAGVREERRVLAKLDGEKRRDAGGYVLRTTDAFLKRSHVPVEVRVEAKDNDPVTGPKWGASPAITVIPPDVGEPEARRVDALRALRDKLVDGLAVRIDGPPPADAAGRKAHLDGERNALADDEAALDAALGASYAGVRVPGRLAAMLRGQLRKVREAQDAEGRAPGTASHARFVGATEKLVLVLDGVIRGLSQKDAQGAAKQLVDVADDLALGLLQMQRGSTGKAPTPGAPGGELERGAARADAATHVLAGGATQMQHLGSLGRDIGEIVQADLRRVKRGRDASPPDLLHAELAARDLAQRLRQPDPSFGSKGRMGHGGGESGGGRGALGADEGGESDAERAFHEAAQDLERLAQDHATELGKVEQALAGATSPEDAKALAEEARDHAKSVRDATKGLPSVGGGSDSWTSKGAAAREHGEQMARALEQGNAADAVQSGRSALGALDEARRMAARERWRTFGDPSAEGASERLDEARRKLEPEVRWAEQKLEQMRKKAADRAGSDLKQSGEEEEGMANRAKDLSQRGRESGSLPQGALSPLDAAEEAAREAARALQRGDAERALEQQREAQRQLEMARDALGHEDEAEERPREDGDDGTPHHGHADIPKADAHKGPEEFRRRVMKGLGQPSSGKHKDAVRRYAEGLLR